MNLFLHTYGAHWNVEKMFFFRDELVALFEALKAEIQIVYSE